MDTLGIHLGETTLTLFYYIGVIVKLGLILSQILFRPPKTSIEPRNVQFIPLVTVLGYCGGTQRVVTIITTFS